MRKMETISLDLSDELVNFLNDESNFIKGSLPDSDGEFLWYGENGILYITDKLGCPEETTCNRWKSINIQKLADKSN